MFSRNLKGYVKQVVDYKSVNFRGEVLIENVSLKIMSIYIYDRIGDFLGSEYK